MKERDVYVGNASNKAVEPTKIYVGASNNIARLASKIYVGNASNKAVQVWPSLKWGDTYQRCEYLLNSGRTQFIELGINPVSNNIRFTLDFWITMLPGSSTDAGVMLSQSSYNGYGIEVNANAYELKFYYNTRNQSTNDQPVATKTFSSASEIRSRHVVDFNRSSGFYVDNELLATSTSTFSVLSYLALWGEYYSPSPVTMEYRVYSFKAYEYDVLIRDMIPCYRKADQVIGMYDLVNDVFYTNSGTGTFYKGPDVN